MPARSRSSHLAAAAAGLLVIAAATAAHVAAGGTVDLYALTALATPSVALCTTLSSRVRLTFARSLTATLLLQPVMHSMLGHRETTPGVATGHAGHAMPVAEPGAHLVASMFVTHAAVGLLCAVVLRWGVRWLRSMPSIARALVLRARTALAPLLTVGDPAPAVPGVAVTPLAVLFTWDTRGPPR